MKKKVLLHTCCAPCSTHVLKELGSYDNTVFYYNPNIDTKEEYEKRRDESRKYSEKIGVDFEEGTYEPEKWEEIARGLEEEEEGGSRCEKCFYLRLKETAEKAREKQYEFFATTLSVSPHKNTKKINEVGKRIETEIGVAFLEKDFKEKNGYQDSVRISKEENLYRQNYCGCRLSKKPLAKDEPKSTIDN